MAQAAPHHSQHRYVYEFAPTWTVLVTRQVAACMSKNISSTSKVGAFQRAPSAQMQTALTSGKREVAYAHSPFSELAQAYAYVHPQATLRKWARIHATFMIMCQW